MPWDEIAANVKFINASFFIIGKDPMVPATHGIIPCAFNFQDNASMNAPLFQYWAHKVFFAQVYGRRNEVNYRGPVPHSSDQTQPLDLLTFTLLKQYLSCSRFHGVDNPYTLRSMNPGLISYMENDGVGLRVGREHARHGRHDDAPEKDQPNLGRAAQERFWLDAANFPTPRDGRKLE